MTSSLHSITQAGEGPASSLRVPPSRRGPSIILAARTKPDQASSLRQGKDITTSIADLIWGRYLSRPL